MRKYYKTNIMMLAIMIMINVLAWYEVCVVGNVGLYDEGGFIESVSAMAFLFSGVLLCFLSLDRLGFERRLTQFFSTTCVVLYLREVDVEKLNVPEFLKFIGADTGRDVLFSGLFLYIIVMVLLRDREGLWDKVRGCFKSVVSRSVLIGSACLLSGAIFEELDFVFYEEVMEMNGALLILLAAFLHIKAPISNEVSELDAR